MTAATGTVSDPIGLVTLFVVGLLAGAHCLGMCGPLVTVYADRMSGTDSRRGPTWTELRQHALFNAGRTAGYAVVGGLFGALGATVFAAGGLLSVGETFRAVVGTVVGAVVVVVGLGYVFRGSAGVPTAALGGSTFGRVQGVLMARVDRWVGGPRIVGLGMVHALLPCPILYPAFLYALDTGSPAQGAVSLAALGLGTFPALFLYGTVVGSVSATLRGRTHRVLGVALVLLGLIPLTKGLVALGVPVPTVSLPMPMLPR